MNPVANYLMTHWGVWGLVVLKVSMVAVVLKAGRMLLRRSLPVYNKLMLFAVVVTAFPLVWTAAHVLIYFWTTSWRSLF